MKALEPLARTLALRLRHLASARSPGRDAVPAGASSASECFDLDPELVAQKKDRRDRRYNVVTIPGLRAVGLLAIVVLVVAHHAVKSGHVPWSHVLPFAGLVIGYALGSWLLLLRCYRRTAPLHLGELFLALDVAIFALAVYFTGGHESWIYFLPWVRVCDQAYRGPRRSLLYAHLALACSLAVLGWSQLVDGVAVAWVPVAFKLGCAHVVGLYVAASSRAAEILRERSTSAVRLARELIVERDRIDAVRRRSESNLKALVDALPDLVLRLDDDGTILDGRAPGGWFLDCDSAVPVGRSLDDVFGESFARSVRSGIDEALETGATSAAEAKLAGDSDAGTAAGSARDVEARVAICAEDQVLLIVRDITAAVRDRSEKEALSRRLAETFHQAGRAEMATGVLHNVGNVLTSVNVSATLVRDKVTRSRVGRLGQACALMEEQGDGLAAFLATDEKGRLLPGFLLKLSTSLQEEREQVLSELSELKQKLEHVSEIVAMQQSYAKAVGVFEWLHATDLIEDALKINDAGLFRHGVEVERDFDELPEIQTDKHKVLQILVNLISNAKYALTKKRDGPRVMTLRVKQTEGREHVRIEVSDNGIGIREEDMPMLFRQGFTTKEDGHGFGLHSSVLAARELGGRLDASSRGVGRGASFVLELPVRREDGEE